MERPQESREDWPVESFDISSARYVVLALVFLLLSAAGAGLASGYIVLRSGPFSPEPGQTMLYFFQVIGFILVALGGIGALVCGMFALSRGLKVSTGPAGVRDTRLTDAWIPWSAVEDFKVVNVENVIPQFAARGILLKIDPAFLHTLKLTRLAQFAQRTNAALGQQGLWIASQGLSGDFEKLVTAVQRGYARAKQARKH